MLIGGKGFLEMLFPGRNTDILYWLIMGGLVGIFLLSSIISGIKHTKQLKKQQQNRENGVQLAAHELRWNYQQLPPANFLPYLNWIGQSRSDGRFYPENVSNVVTGQIGKAKIAFFDHTFTVQSRSSHGGSQTYWETVFLVISDQLNLPNFHTQEEGFLDSFFNNITNRPDINFPHRPKFSGQYLLRGMETDRIRRLFTDPVLKFYEDQFPLETIGGGNCLCIFQPRENNASATKDEILQWIQGLMQLRDMFAR